MPANVRADPCRPARTVRREGGIVPSATTPPCLRHCVMRARALVVVVVEGSVGGMKRREGVI